MNRFSTAALINISSLGQPTYKQALLSVLKKRKFAHVAPTDRTGGWLTTFVPSTIARCVEWSSVSFNFFPSLCAAKTQLCYFCDEKIVKCFSRKLHTSTKIGKKLCVKSLRAHFLSSLVEQAVNSMPNIQRFVLLAAVSLAISRCFVFIYCTKKLANRLRL